MCGIAGYVSKAKPVSETVLNRMADVLVHRGPDDSGIFISPDKHTGIVHRRLSFIDLSAAGHQPMVSVDGNIVVSLNGEIYNFVELRKELTQAGCSFQTLTDTEVLIHGYTIWGLEMPKHLKGMFAFSLYDVAQNKLLLVRDRFGIKPLFYGNFENSFSYGSEIKAILEVPETQRNIRKQSVAEFLANRYVPTPHTMWQNIFKLPPASILELNTNTLHYDISTYWHLNVAANPIQNLNKIVAHKLQTSVSEHLRSDVPIGTFLSGGMDSTALVSLMKNEVDRPQAFAIGFENWNESEHKYAQLAADALGAELHSLILKETSLEDVSTLMHHYDDPIADISILPTYSVSGLAAKTVKAVLGGEGADECFGGYWWQQPSRFWFANKWTEWKSKLFGTSFQAIKQHYIQAMSMGLFDKNELEQALGKDWKTAIPNDPFAHFDKFELPKSTTLKQIQYLDINTFMYELILNKVDRASMAHSLEVRVPFLDHELVEFMFSASEESYFDPTKHKTIIRNLLAGKVPEAIYNRPKQGFVGPDVFYMNFALYEKKLKNGRLITEGVINASYLEKLFTTKDHWKLWKLFVLENWWESWN